MQEIYSPVAVSITELKKDPMMVAEETQVCVMKRGKPAYYVVSVERMAEIAEMESRLNADKSEVSSQLLEQPMVKVRRKEKSK